MSTNPRRPRTLRPRGHRRGSGIATVIIMLAIINLAVIGAVRASGDESQVGAMRAETARAFYAAESGVRVVIKCSTAGLAMPAAASTLSLGTATCTFESIPAPGQPGDAVVNGTDGTAARRLKVTLVGS